MKKLISAILVITLAAAVVFAFAGCKKNPTKEYEDLRFIYEDIIEDDVLLEKYANDVHRYRDIIADDFGLGEENTDNFYENFAEYYIYGMTVKTLNYTESDITILSVESDSNGKNGVYIRKSINGGENGNLYVKGAVYGGVFACQGGKAYVRGDRPRGKDATPSA